MPDNTLSPLSEIRIKVRRLTRSPSEAQLPTADIDKYVNNFVLYDLPEHLRLKGLRTTLTFYTDPYIDTYQNNTADPLDPLYNFKNNYISIHGPVYVAGYQALFSQSQEQFFAAFPRIQFQENIGTGDGVTTAFNGTLTNKPILRNNVLFSAVDLNDNGLAAYDDGAGGLLGDDTGFGVINYVTGQYVFQFTTAPKNNTTVYAQTVPYVVGRPNSVLFYDNKFVLRPIPDQPYKVDVEAYQRPTELLAAGSMPDLSQWWQYIAYGAAKKILEDRMDIESISKIMPEFKIQERLVLRRSIVQQSNERVATFYTDTIPYNSGSNNNFGSWF